MNYFKVHIHISSMSTFRCSDIQLSYLYKSMSWPNLYIIAYSSAVVEVNFIQILLFQFSCISQELSSLAHYFTAVCAKYFLSD